MTEQDILDRLLTIERIPTWTYWWLPAEKQPTLELRLLIAVHHLLIDIATSSNGRTLGSDPRNDRSNRSVVAK
jgi:hypothetical protein